MKSKRILIISTYFPPQPSIASLRAYSFAKYWAKLGHEVTVLTTKKNDMGNMSLDLPCDNFTVVEVPYVNIKNEGWKIFKKLFRKKKIHGQNVTIMDTSGEIIKIGGSFLRLRNFINKVRTKYGFYTTARIPDDHDTWVRSAVKKGEELIKSKRFDFILSSYGPPASHLVAGIFSKRYKTKWIADYRDLWIEGHIYPGMWPFTVIEKYLEKKYVGNYADLLTTVSQPLANILSQKFSAPVYVIENGYDEDDYNKIIPPYFKSVKKRLIYTGTIYPGRQDPSPLFVALALIVKKNKIMKKNIMSDFEVLFFGNHNDWLAGLIENYQLEPWVKQMGNVGRKDIISIQNQADVLLFLEWESKSVGGILTGKLFEYFATRKPILGIGVTPQTSSGVLMEKAGVGIAVGHDTEKIVFIIENILNDKIPFDIHPKNHVINKYTRKKQAEKLLTLMEKEIHF